MAIDNFSRMPKRRIKLTVGVTYETTSTQMRLALEKNRPLLKEHPAIHQEFMLVHFTDSGPSSLAFLYTSSAIWSLLLQCPHRFFHFP